MFSVRLKELRERNGYTSQQSFADKFGVAQSTVGGWESGKREPNYSTTIKLANFFGVTIDELLGIVPLTDSGCGYWDGHKLQQYRKSNGENADYVARSIGVSNSVYLAIECGEREPSLEMLCKLADHFGTSTDDLLNFVWRPCVNGKPAVGDFHITPKEQHLVELYRNASQKDKDIVNFTLGYDGDNEAVPSENVG